MFKKIKIISVLLILVTCVFILLIPVLIFYRNHFLLGSCLLFLKIPLFLSGIILLIIYKKRKSTFIFYGVLSISLLLAGEWCFVQLNTKFHFTKKDTKQEIKLLSYNLFFRNKNTKSAVKKIIKSDPDILAVQELTPYWSKVLHKSLDKKYPYRYEWPHRGTHGLGIYSKYPLSNVKYLYNSAKLPIAQCVKVKAKKREAVICNIHLTSPGKAVENLDNFVNLYSKNYRYRVKQINQLNKFILSYNRNINDHIVLGDLNTLKIEPVYRDFRKEWIDLYGIAGDGLGLTFPNCRRLPFPVITIDYIFFRGNINPLQAKVIKGGSSDHLALEGTVVL